VVVTTGWWLLGVRHALGGRADLYEWYTFPPDSALHPGWYDDGDALTEAPNAARQLTRRLQAGPRRVWLVRTPALGSDGALDVLVTGLGLRPVDAREPVWSVWGPTALVEEHGGLTVGRADPPPGRGPSPR